MTGIEMIKQGGAKELDLLHFEKVRFRDCRLSE